VGEGGREGGDAHASSSEAVEQRKKSAHLDQASWSSPFTPGTPW